MAHSNVTGIDQWVRTLQAYEREVHVKAEAAVEAALDDHIAVSDPLTPVKTGYLKSRNQKRMTERGGTGNRYSGEYYNDTPYGPFVAWGTRSMAARDFVTPGFAYARARFMQRCQSIV